MPYRKMDESGVSVVIGFYDKKFTIKDIIELNYCSFLVTDLVTIYK